MEQNERMDTFLDSLETPGDGLLTEIEKEAEKANLPVIRKETRNLLTVLVQIKQPQRVLEIGTAIGFSALLMSEAAPEDCQIFTIEKNKDLIRTAQSNVKKAGKEKQVTVLEGDAGKILPTLEDPFDFIFLDGPKGQYLAYLPELKRLLAPGSVLVSDNVLQEETLLDSRYAISRRDRTIHERMRDYLYSLKNDPDLSTAILTVGDGVSVSVASMKEMGRNERKDQ